MNNLIFKNKQFLQECLKFASTKTSSKNATDIYVEFIRLAASGGFNEMLKLPELQIKEVLGRLGKYEDKKYELRKILKDNLGTLSYIAFERTEQQPAEVKDKLSEWFSHNFVDYMIGTLLEKYNGSNSKNFALSGAINGAINNAIQNVNKLKLKKKDFYVEDLAEKGVQLISEVPEEETSQEISSDPNEQINFLQELLNQLYKQTDLTLTAIKIRTKYQSKIDNLRLKLSKGEDIFDQLTDTRIGLQKFQEDLKEKSAYLYKDEQAKRSMPIQDFEREILKDSELMKKAKEIAENVIESPNFTLPKFFGLTNDPKRKQTIIFAIENLIIAWTIKQTAQTFGVPISGAMRREQGGSAKADFGKDFLVPLMEINAHKIEENPEAQKAIINEALLLFGKYDKYDKSYKQEHHKTKTVGNLALHGMIEQERKRINGFSNLTDADIEQIVNNIFLTLHDTNKAHIPHSHVNPANQSQYLLKYPDEDEQEIKNNIRKEILNIAHKEEEAKNSENLPGSNTKESALNILIKKYAKNQIYR
jgi:hypothetical protein